METDIIARNDVTIWWGNVDAARTDGVRAVAAFIQQTAISAQLTELRGNQSATSSENGGATHHRAAIVDAHLFRVAVVFLVIW